MGQMYIGCYLIEPPKALADRQFDFILLAVVHGIWDIKQQLIEMGISEQKYFCGLAGALWTIIKTLCLICFSR